MAREINTNKTILTISLTEADKKKLNELSNAANMTNTGYIRMLLDAMWVSHNWETILKTGKFEVDGQEFSLDPLALTQIGEEIVETLSEVDWDKLQLKARKKTFLRRKEGYKKAS